MLPVATASRRRPPRRAGLRVRIVLALAGLTVLAFGPLYFAVASLARATVQGAREQAAAALGEAIATHVFDAMATRDVEAVAHALRAQCARPAHPDVVAACAFAIDGHTRSCAGDPSAAASVRAPASGPRIELRTTPDDAGRGTEEVIVRSDIGAVVARLRTSTEPGAGRALVRLVALYMAVFALATIVFAASALTRLIVRPLDALVKTADRVAGGARTVRFPRSGARELVELGASVETMAEALVAEEAALLAKIRELTETTTRLTEAQFQLVRSERMASVGRLAAGLAHEIGNPLAALMGMQDVLLDDMSGLQGDEPRDFLRRMRRETERIHRVVRDLLDFARPERDADTADLPDPGDVAAVADDVLALVRPQPSFRRVRIEREVDAGLRVALSGPQLTQVLLNLMLNAGAAIAAAGRSGTVIVRARAAGDRVHIDVEDDGPGVAPAIRERLFEPFATTKDIGEGTGLGLAVCRGLVEGAGGEIGLDASCATGARFRVVLPAAGTMPR